MCLWQKPFRRAPPGGSFRGAAPSPRARQAGGPCLENLKTVTKLTRSWFAFIITPFAQNNVSDKIVLPEKKAYVGLNSKQSLQVLLILIYKEASNEHILSVFKNKHCILFRNNFRELPMTQLTFNTRGLSLTRVFYGNSSNPRGTSYIYIQHLDVWYIRIAQWLQRQRNNFGYYVNTCFYLCTTFAEWEF